MLEPKFSFFARLLRVLQAFWRTLSDPEFARSVARLSQGALLAPV